MFYNYIVKLQSHLYRGLRPLLYTLENKLFYIYFILLDFRIENIIKTKNFNFYKCTSKSK